jgi:hypothetical protein
MRLRNGGAREMRDGEAVDRGGALLADRLALA